MIIAASKARDETNFRKRKPKKKRTKEEKSMKVIRFHENFVNPQSKTYFENMGDILHPFGKKCFNWGSFGNQLRSSSLMFSLVSSYAS